MSDQTRKLRMAPDYSSIDGRTVSVLQLYTTCQIFRSGRMARPTHRAIVVIKKSVSSLREADGSANAAEPSMLFTCILIAANLPEILRLIAQSRQNRRISLTSITPKAD